MAVDQLVETKVKAKAEPASSKLKPNPFNAYRDPLTGRWTIIKSSAVA